MCIQPITNSPFRNILVASMHARLSLCLCAKNDNALIASLLSQGILVDTGILFILKTLNLFILRHFEPVRRDVFI